VAAVLATLLSSLPLLCGLHWGHWGRCRHWGHHCTRPSLSSCGRHSCCRGRRRHCSCRHCNLRLPPPAIAVPATSSSLSLSGSLSHGTRHCDQDHHRHRLIIIAQPLSAVTRTGMLKKKGILVSMSTEAGEWVKGMYHNCVPPL
jgi:hypothetical protein